MVSSACWPASSLILLSSTARSWLPGWYGLTGSLTGTGVLETASITIAPGVRVVSCGYLYRRTARRPGESALVIQVGHSGRLVIRGWSFGGWSFGQGLVTRPGRTVPGWRTSRARSPRPRPRRTWRPRRPRRRQAARRPRARTSAPASASSTCAEARRFTGTAAPITTRPGSLSRASGFTCSAGISAASTTRRGGAAGSAASSRSEARAASVSAVYSSSSSSPLAYASRSEGVTANPGTGPGPTWPACRAWASAGSVEGRNTRMVPQSLP